MILHGFLTDLSALVGFCTWNPQSGIKWQLRYRRGGLYSYLL